MSTRKSAFDFFRLQNTVGIENVTLSRIALRYYRDSVTVILTAPSLQTYVMSRAVMEQIVTQSRRLVEFGQCKTQTADCGLRTADCGPGVKCRLCVKCRLQNKSKTQAGIKCRPSINCSRGRV